MDPPEQQATKPKRAALIATFAGAAGAIFFAACCAGLLGIFGIGGLVLTLGAYKLNLLTDAVLLPLLGLSAMVMAVGIFVQFRQARSHGQAP